jgi:hypothetical protein
MICSPVLYGYETRSLALLQQMLKMFENKIKTVLKWVMEQITEYLLYSSDNYIKEFTKVWFITSN